tara:strand:- start:307 stop:561 length:255 start_codon:yes stop_codon:yes gene_type:complete
MTRKFKIVLVTVFFMLFFTIDVSAKKPRKAKFYDFGDQLINGEIRKPTTLYTDARKRVQFERLLRLKKSFMHELFETGKERVFR